MIDSKQRCCLADSSAPGSAANNVCPATAVLDSGAGITIMSGKVEAKLRAVLPTTQVVTSMARGHPVKVADGDVGSMQSRTCSVQTALHTRQGPVVLDPCHYLVIPGADDVMILAGAASWRLWASTFVMVAGSIRTLKACLGKWCGCACIRECIRVSIEIEALQDVGESEEPVDPPRSDGCHVVQGCV